MRGSEGQEGRSYPSTVRPPLPPTHQHPANGQKASSSSRQGQIGSSDVISFSERASDHKHKRTPGSSSDPMVSYKRVIENEVLKDNGSDVFTRPPKTKVAKSKSDTSSIDMKTPAYAPTHSVNKNPKRQKQSKREKSEKLSVSKFPKSDSGRPHLGRRSMTFVVDPRVTTHPRHAVTSDQTWREPKGKVGPFRTRDEQETTTGSQKISKQDSYPDFVSNKGSEDRTVYPDDVPLKTKAPGRQEVGGSRDQTRWDDVTDFDRDGARNPLYISAKSMPVRPKSAGQIRYCPSDDSDESSLDGEIEIVDIDKELEEEPSEVSPYWTEGQPLQVPEVFINNDDLERPHPMTSRRNHHHQDLPQHHNGRLYHSEYQLRHEPDPYQESRPSYDHDLAPRARHNSGESDLSALSDTVMKPKGKPKGRRRFMSEPEILREPFLDRNSRRGGGDSKFRGNGVQRKGGDVLIREVSHDGAEMTTVTASTLARQSRERLYSDAMERVLSRYSELAVREADDLTRSSTKTLATKTSAVNKSSTSGHMTSGSGFIIPPRKLKPINRQPRNHMNDPS